MMPRRHPLIPALLAFGLGLLAACGTETDPPAAAGAKVAEAGAGKPERPNQLFYDYRLIESQSGVKQWILESAEMQKFTGQRDVILVDVHMDFFRAGEHFSVLVADSGRANIQTRKVFTWGDVVVTTDDGRRLETQELHFDNESGLIHNDVFNRFTRKDDVMTGIGLEATPDLEYIELKRDVKAAVTDSTDLAGPASSPPRREGEGE